jgi:ribonuclease-3
LKFKKVMSLPSFTNQDLLTTALTHRSALNERLSTSPESNERLEFLGDAVLELATTVYLYKQMPQEQEGMLTAYRSALVKTTTLADVARELGLGDQLFMSRGEEASGGRQNVGLLANAVEALIGALYLDQGYDAAEQFLAKQLFPKLKEIQEKKLYKDPKSQLQELVQAKGFDAPEYIVIEEVGPDHDRQFTIKVLINGREGGQGKGRSKQIAQQEAAQYVLSHQDSLDFLR